MKISLIGCGCGRESLIGAAEAAVKTADALIGAPRLLELFPEAGTRIPALTPKEIADTLSALNCNEICVLFSGDSGFYSGARLLLPMLPETDEWQILPGISSLQVLAARLEEPWQNWRLCSAHGVECDPVWEVCHGQKVFFLTGGKLGPTEICSILTEAGLGTLSVVVGEQLGSREERICRGSASEFAGTTFSPLSCMLVEAAPRKQGRTPGLPDSEFERTEKVPMTKQEVRAAALAKLGVKSGDTCWDIGAGTGSVAVELALQARAVWAVERDEEALRIAARNREKHGAWNLHLKKGSAPEALEGLPKPDAVFVGGSGGKLEEILNEVYYVNREARICISAIALETLQCAVECLRKRGYETEICQIAVSRNRQAGDLTLMLAQNPVYLITGRPA